MEGQNVPDIGSMDVNEAVRVGMVGMTTGETNMPARTG
jgi:hypothetical protein